MFYFIFPRQPHTGLKRRRYGSGGYYPPPIEGVTLLLQWVVGDADPYVI